MKKFTIIFVIIMVLVAVWVLFGCGETPPPPPGYKVLCSAEGEKYCLWMPGSKGSKGYLSANIWDSEKEAIEFAYYWERLDSKVYISDSDKYEWSECKEEKE